MAANMAGTRVEETSVVGADAEHTRRRMPRLTTYGAVAAILVALLVAGVAIHDRTAPHPAAVVIIRPVDLTEQQKFLEVNTTMPDPGEALVPGITPASIMTREQQKFLEVNTILPVPAPSSYMEEFTPLPGQPR